MYKKNEAINKFGQISMAKVKAQANYTKGKFNRKLLPSPIKVLNSLGINPGKPNQAGYWRLRCPSHKAGKEKNPSLNLHQNTGHFKCHTCAAKGRDILAFYMLVTQKKFIEAAKDLGVWEEK